MAIFPEAIFQFTRPQDLATQLFQVVHRNLSQLVAAGNTGASSILMYLPKDRGMVVTSWGWFFAVAGATTYFNHGMLTYNTAGPGINLTADALSDPDPNASILGVTKVRGKNTNVIIPPGGRISIGIYSIDVTDANTTVNYFLNGFTFPRGNLTEG